MRIQRVPLSVKMQHVEEKGQAISGKYRQLRSPQKVTLEVTTVRLKARYSEALDNLRYAQPGGVLDNDRCGYKATQARNVQPCKGAISKKAQAWRPESITVLGAVIREVGYNRRLQNACCWMGKERWRRRRRLDKISLGFSSYPEKLIRMLRWNFHTLFVWTYIAP